MGSCVSLQKHPEKPGKIRILIGSKNHKLVNPSSPVKQKNTAVVNGVFSSENPTKSHLSPSLDFGSKEEMFFDSQVYLESDCDDDFYSVKGDFTPSRGNTPIHHSFSAASPKLNGPLFTEKAPVPKPLISPTEKKKRLLELFKESLGGSQEFDALNHSKDLTIIPLVKDSEFPPKSSAETPYSSACSNGTPSRELKRALKPTKLGECCFPRLRTGAVLARA